MKVASTRIWPFSTQGAKPVELTPAMICAPAMASIWSAVPL